MKWNLVCSSVTALLLTCASAHSQDTNQSWFISLGSGVQFPHLNSHMTVDNNSGFPSPHNQDLYSVKVQDAAVLAASAGRRWETNNFWLPSYSLGLFWQYFFQTRIHGKILQYSLPEFTNYNYHWDFTSNVLLPTAKVNLFKYRTLSPYINGGVGTAFNQTHYYQEIALAGVTQRVSPEFRTANHSNFTYNAGAGLDLQYSPQLILSAGYIYQDLGKITSGYGRGAWSTQALKPGTYHANEVLISATYLFDAEKNLTK